MALIKLCLDLPSMFSANICVNNGQIVPGNNNVAAVTSHFFLLFPPEQKLYKILFCFPSLIGNIKKCISS